MSEPQHDAVAHLEADETIPPRPEEEVADVARAEPDTGTVPVVGEPGERQGDRRRGSAD